MASINRGSYSWKRKKGQPDASLADYAISIRMQPNKVESYDYSIDVGEQKSDPERALEDYNHATHRTDLCYRPS